MRFNVTLITLCCWLAFFTACKKSRNDSATKQKLMAGIWKISAETVTFNYNGKDTTIDDYSQWRSCEQDDLVMFDTDGKGTTNENTDKCPEDDQADRFNWELMDNDTKLKITLDNGYFQSTHTQLHISDILEITDTYLKIREVDSLSTLPGIYIETYKNIK